MAKIVKNLFEESSFLCLRDLTKADNLNELGEMLCAALGVVVLLSYLQFL